MKIGIVVTYTKEYEGLANIALPNIADYCRIHGYTLEIDQQWDEDMNRSGAWNKIKVCRKILHLVNYDWIFYMDIDCLIMNPSIKLEDLIDDKYSFIVPAHNIPAVDTPVPNELGTDCVITSQFFVKNNDIGKAILDDIWEAKEWPSDMPIDTFDYEGRQARVTLAKEEFENHVKIVEEEMLNRFWYVNNPFHVIYNRGVNDLVWKPGDFIVHVTSYPIEERVKLMDQLSFFSGGLLVGFKKGDGSYSFQPLEDLEDVWVQISEADTGKSLVNYSFERVLMKNKYLLFTDDSVTSKDVIIKGYANRKLISTKLIKGNAEAS